MLGKFGFVLTMTSRVLTMSSFRRLLGRKDLGEWRNVVDAKPFEGASQDLADARARGIPTSYLDINGRFDEDDWLSACQAEDDRLEEFGTCEIINEDDVALGESIGNSMRAFQKTRNSKIKSRTVYCGHRQIDRLLNEF